MKYIIIIVADGLITNTVEWDGVAEWSPPEGCTAIESDDGSIGDSYIDGETPRSTARAFEEV